MKKAYLTKEKKIKSFKLTKEEYKRLWCGNCKAKECPREEGCEVVEDIYLIEKRKKW